MNARFKDDTGAVAVTFALILLLLVGISALAVDVGYWYACKRQLQSAADAAALAGCQVLARDGVSGAVTAAAEDLAGRNFSAPLEAPASRVLNTEIGSDYVKVTAETDANVFLAHFILGRSTTAIQAQSVAKVGWLAGGRGPVPWGLTILNIDDLSASLGGEQRSLSQSSDGYWSTAFSAGQSGGLTIRARNGQGYVEEFENLLSVAALPAGGRITGVDVSKSTLTSGVDTSVRVSVTLASPLAAGGKLEATAGSSKVDLTEITETEYEGNVPVGTTSDPYTKLSLVVSIQEGNQKSSVTSGLLLRRANYILQDIDIHPVAVTTADSVTMRIKPLNFEYGVQYQLKVEGGTGTTGNYQALDFAALDHSNCGYPEFPDAKHSGGASYRDNIEGNEGIVIHLNDLITTLPGNMVGPTSQGIADRLSGSPVMTFAAWESAGKPETKQLCLIPICEKVEDLSGRSRLRIISFATFFLEVPPSGQDPVIGRFIEWSSPGWFVVGDKPSGDMAVTAVHLTSEHLDK